MTMELDRKKRALELERVTVDWGLPAALLVSLGVKLWLIFSGAVPFNADEAIVALMGRHIQAGARPIFFYGQAYMGSLDAFLVAGGFELFGQQVWVIRLIQAILYLLTMVTTAWLGRQVFGSWIVGVLAAWFLAVPPVNLGLYTTASLGNYGEALLLGNLILILGLRIANILREEQPIPWGLWALWGFFVGLGVWTFGLTLVYSLPMGMVLLIFALRGGPSRQASLSGGLAVAGGMIGGALPWLMYAWQTSPGLLLRELGAGGVAGVEGLSWLSGVWQHIINFAVLGTTVIFGLRPPWEVRWLAWPLLPFALTFWLGVVVFSVWQLVKKSEQQFGIFILASVGLVLVAGFILTPFGVDPSGRYFLPLNIILALFAADLVQFLHTRFGVWPLVLPVLVLGFNLMGTIQSAWENPPGLTTQFDAVTQIDHTYDGELIRFLSAQGEYNGYSNYWVAYPLAFQSAERLIFIPRLPYHPDFRFTLRDDRYGPYTQKVEAADRIAYITTNHPDLNHYLRENLRAQGINWLEKEIGSYHVFYDLSKKVSPEELGLGR